MTANNCNTMYVHVRAFSDAMYPSDYYPWSLYINSNGNGLSYDPVEIMVSTAHSYGIKFHAWINPYRLSASTDKTNKLLSGTYIASHQAKFNEWKQKGMITQKTYNNNNCLFLEPGNANARNLIVSGVREVVSKYPVDGVVFDDYFYVWEPNVAGDASEIRARMDNVNALISSVYSTIKSVNPNVQFGISPEGNINNAKNQGCDLDTWLSTSGYIDYIAPQIYWTDNYTTSSGTVTMFTNRLNSWIAMVKNGIPVYPALALYRAGVTSSTDMGWSSKNYNLKEQWDIASGKGCKGYSLFSYSYMLSGAGKTEMDYLNGKLGLPGNKTNITYQTHVQDIGWQSPVYNGASAGTTGKSKRLESINIKVDSQEYAGGIEYRTHVQDIGWMDWVSDGANSGTSGQSKRLEAIQIRLTGELAQHYDVYYRVHAQDYGWLDWAVNGQVSGTSGKSKRLEAIEIILVEKGGAAPGPTGNPSVETLVSYSTHIQNIGWQAYRDDGAMSGTSGRSYRLEAIKIKLANQKYSGDIVYRVHCQNVGWMDWVSNGALSGTSGRSLRLEAIEIKLTGEMAEHYDVLYRVHCQNLGWMDWVSNGATAGTSGRSLRLEAIEIKLVPKQ